MKSVLVIFLGLSVFSLVVADSPVLFFSDLVDGPRSGNSDTSLGQPAGTHGAIVTIWGKFLGSEQSNSKVYCGGVLAPYIYSWGDATSPANLYASHGMQMIAFQIDGATPTGDQTIKVEVNGVESNELPFHIRSSGAILFVSTSGSDGDGRGSWTQPFRTLINSNYNGAFNKMASGDIVYALDGVSATEQVLDGCIDTIVNGAEGASSALIGYPGATVTVGSDNCEAVRTFISSVGYSTYWTISKIHFAGTRETGIPMNDGWRSVGNRFECKQLYDAGQSGVVAGSGNYLTAVGNEFLNTAETNAATISKLQHVIYFQSARSEDSPRLPTETNKEVAWNYFHDNHVYSAINFYSEGTYTAYFEKNYIHDNVIYNQRGAGILAGPYMTGNDNYIYNNVIVNAGLGPEGPEGCSGQTGLQIFVGWDTAVETTIYIVSNTIVDSGFAASSCSFTAAVYFGLYPNAKAIFRNNIISQDPSYGPMLLIDSDTPSGENYTNNLWFGQDAPSWDTAAITSDPLFVDKDNRNFHLKDISPAIGAGVDTRYVAAFDIEGLARPSAMDVGAYQYAAAPPGGWYQAPTVTPSQQSPSGQQTPSLQQSPASRSPSTRPSAVNYGERICQSASLVVLCLLLACFNFI